MQVKKEKHVRGIAIFSPGWPMSSHPNGIVTYVNNILLGFGSQIRTVILTESQKDSELYRTLIDLSKLKLHKKVYSKLFDTLLFKLNYKFVRSTQYKRTWFLKAKKIAYALNNLGFAVDILEMEETYGTPYFLLKMTKVPIVTRLHGPLIYQCENFYEEKHWDFDLRVFYEGQAIKKSHGITAPSLDVLEKVRKYYGIALPNAQVIANPVTEVDASKRWQINKDRRQYVLFVGRFDHHKGGDLILDAFQLIALKNDAIELLFVGPDRKVIIDGESFSFSEYLERFIPEVAIKNRIQFMGHCDQDRISDLRKNALVTVVCSRYENFPLSLLESLAAGCPTVATAVGGMKEIIIDDFNGLLAESESAENIAEKVLILISDPEKMQRLSKNAIEDCKKRFSPEVVAAQTLEYYESVLERVANSALKK